MKVRLLGTAAGGGIPQWNCHCVNCGFARSDPAEVRARSQSSVAISGDGERWFLLNASPDVRFQIEAFAPLRSRGLGVRGTAVEAVLLTNADLDHCLGLALLREGERLTIYATASVHGALQAGWQLPALLESYGGADWREPPKALGSLQDRSGRSTGLRYRAFPVPGKPPRYREGQAPPEAFDNVGYLFEDEVSGGRLAFIPDMASIDDQVLEAVRDCQALLLDGTFWSETEMEGMGSIARPASAMAHLPVGGAAGSLQWLSRLPIPRKVFLHINNTNPMVRASSSERALVEAAGVTIGEDGMELTC